ncbi:hypothetical protein N7456_002167 [Penicillium angulare]|uniref:Zn(2)-C6 fungal-type domain-containing protein n=1 Tax=Penicillium angulare TaxID=116970 RepID=A0A9W9G7R8_9EURO|nr:hypothetical protein N7456_002167 [Penicillium angulare]
MDNPKTPTQHGARSSHTCGCCRTRKRRCVTSSGPYCDNCADFGLECTFNDPGLGRGIRRKRQRRNVTETPSQLPSRQPDQVEDESIVVPSPSENTTPGGVLAELDLMTPQNGDSTPPIAPILPENGVTVDLDWALVITAKYQQYIEPYAPFLDTSSQPSDLSLCFLAAAVQTRRISSE